MKYEQELAHRFLQEQQISQAGFNGVEQQLSGKKLSLHWELRVLLYIGISLLTTGLGIFVYKNIGSIGHLVLIAMLFGGCAWAYWFAFKKALPYTREAVQHNNPFYDYVVLLAALLFVSAQGYLQYQFDVFGSQLSIPTLLASGVLFLTAFRFDHKGVLSIAISTLALFFGLVITPVELVQSSAYFENGTAYINSGILFSALLYGAVWLCRSRGMKLHFVPIFLQFGVNISLISLLAGTFGNSIPGFYYLLLLAVSSLWVNEYRRTGSFAIFLSAVLFNYIALSYWIVRMAINIDNLGMFYLIFMYFMGSAVAVILLLRNHKKFLPHA